MVVDGRDGLWTMDYDALVAKSGREESGPRVSTRFSVVVENKRADMGQDGRPNLSRETKLSGANGEREKLLSSPCLIDLDLDWQSGT